MSRVPSCAWVMLLTIALAKPLIADEAAVLREREDALARALNAKDKAALLRLTDGQFHVYWAESSPERFFTTHMGREDWIDDLMRLRIDAYEAVILKIELAGRGEAFVDLDEVWSIRSPRGTRIEKRFLTRDFWFKLQGTWRLTGRNSRPYVSGVR